MNIRAFIAISFILLSASCGTTKLTTADVVNGVETAVGQTAAVEMAKQTLIKMTSAVGLTKQQSDQIFPMLQQYYTSTATALKNNKGTQGILQGLKNTFLSQVKGVITPQQYNIVKGMI